MKILHMNGIILTYLKVFLTGGTICLLAQILINYTKITAGKILVLFMLSGVFLQAIGVYEKLVEFGESGATVPISGFGYLLANGAMEGAKKGLIEALTGGYKSAAAGITSAVIFSFIVALIFKPRSKTN